MTRSEATVDTVALVVAAGRGRRFGGELPKQYAALDGRPVLRHTLAALAAHPKVSAVRAVIHADDRALYDEAVGDLEVLEPVPGGATRQQSVRLGLESLEPLAPARVLIHDGARPFVTPPVIERVLSALEQAPGAIAALPVTDTLKRETAGAIAETLPRGGLWRAQTPQGFDFARILAAHRTAPDADLTDDAAVAELAGLSVRLVEGAADNVKITTQDDLERARQRLSGGTEFRTGSGFDVHRFGPGDHVMLCGIKVQYSHGLVGHSDADVGLHALTDAILGGLCEGDIGSHFPPSDARWRGAESAVFLRHACALLQARGGALVHADVTLICERPKVGPHRAAMAMRIAEICGIETGRVSVKATTTEGLGFTGRQEGIAAQATATLRLPMGVWGQS
ncbi:MAG: bifunctional 2-C-methyl-D-erythritol 4-phosphate cytidylyltransferase/2-C-methyl-D-erythritol 2,4-cyclodiphosphate synthase [Kiloniellales bacterium]